MILRPGKEKLKNTLATILSRSRPLKPQTQRHLYDHVDGQEANFPDFFARAARELEDYQFEILFAPMFTPGFNEQLEVTECLTNYRPDQGETVDLIIELTATIDSAPVVLPDGSTAPLLLHEVLIERFVKLLCFERTPSQEVTETIIGGLSEESAKLTLTLMRRTGMTPDHQEWLTQFLIFASDRHPLERDVLEALVDFLSSQDKLDHESLSKNLDGLLRATIEAGNFAQQGRRYWSSDVAEHHQFRGQGIVDAKQVEEAKREFRVLELLTEDLKSFASTDN